MMFQRSQNMTEQHRRHNQIQSQMYSLQQMPEFPVLADQIRQGQDAKQHGLKSFC